MNQSEEFRSALEFALRAALERVLGPGQVHDAKSGPTPPEAFCTVTTLNAATGLEAPESGSVCKS